MAELPYVQHGHYEWGQNVDSKNYKPRDILMKDPRIRNRAPQLTKKYPPPRLMSGTPDFAAIVYEVYQRQREKLFDQPKPALVMFSLSQREINARNRQLTQSYLSQPTTYHGNKHVHLPQEHSRNKRTTPRLIPPRFNNRIDARYS